jgi:hypothetical protein
MNVQQEPDSVVVVRVAWIGAISTVIAIVASIIAWQIERAATHGHADTFANAPPPPATADSVVPLRAPRPLGTVDRTLLDARARGLDERPTRRAKLDEWGYADRDAGIAIIPIDRAMDLWLARRSRFGTSEGSSAISSDGRTF